MSAKPKLATLQGCPRFGDIGQRLADNGYMPVPVTWGKKSPAEKGWREFDPERLASSIRSQESKGTGILCGNVAGVDIDLLRPDLASKLDALAVTVLGEAPKRVGKAPKSLRLYRIEESFGKIQTPMYRFADDPPIERGPGGFKGHKVEILAEGQQFVAYNIHPDTKQPYAWDTGGSPLEVRRDGLPAITKEQAQSFVAECERLLVEAGATKVGDLDTVDTNETHISNDRLVADDPQDCRAALDAIPNNDEEYDEFIKMMHAVKGALGEGGLDAFQQWSRKSVKHDEAENIKYWRRTHPTKIGAGTIYHLAQKAGWRPLLTTDEGNGIRLYRAFGADVRWVQERRCFFYWDGNRWKADESGQRIMRRAKRALDCIWDELKNAPEDQRKVLTKHALHSKNRRPLTDAIEMLKSEGNTTMSVEAFDANPWLLGVKNGTVDLRTGQFYQGQREDYISKSTGCAYDDAAECPRWEQFVDEIMGGDKHLTEYLQRCFGYTLTGSTRDQCFLFLWGPKGKNGKSTCLGVLGDLFGEYAQELPTAIIAEGTKMFAHANTPELAKLKGARLAQINEVPENMRFNTVTIKDITGGDRITACAKYEHPISFYPIFKLIIRGNNQPSFSSNDEAFVRRLKAIPFTQCFSPGSPGFDSDLPEKLRAALPGILNWAIRGCLAWQQRGLHVDVPTAVSNTTSEWVEAQVTFEDFIAERCALGEGNSCLPTEIYAAYKDWFRGQPGRTLAQKQFRRSLEDFVAKKHLNVNLDGKVRVGGNPVRAYTGISVVFPARDY